MVYGTKKLREHQRRNRGASWKHRAQKDFKQGLAEFKAKILMTIWAESQKEM